MRVDVEGAELLRDLLRAGNDSDPHVVKDTVREKCEEVRIVGVQNRWGRAVNVRERPRHLVDLRRGAERTDERPLHPPLRHARSGATA